MVWFADPVALILSSSHEPAVALSVFAEADYVMWPVSESVLINYREDIAS